MNSQNDNPTYEGPTDRSGGRRIEPEFISTREVAQRLRWSVRTIRAKIRAGVLRRGVHFFQPRGCQCRWKWSAIVEWLESDGSSVRGAERLRLPAHVWKEVL